MWVLWDTESLQCINISEWFLFHAYISDVTLIFATDYYKACTSMWTWAWAIRVQIYMSNKIRSVKIIWSLGNEQKHSHDFSIHMQLYRVFMKSKYNSYVLGPQFSISKFSKILRHTWFETSDSENAGIDLVWMQCWCYSKLLKLLDR